MAALAAVVVLLCWTGWQQLRPAATPASPNGADLGWEHPFPQVDWTWWQDVNPDVVAWLTIPSTAVNGPVCKAPEGDEEFYLHHDAYGEPSAAGCLFLDASSGSEPFDKANAVICGHNAGDGLMLAPVARYASSCWAEAHRTVFLQTPEGAWAYEVAATEIIDGIEPAKRTSFCDQLDFERWWQARIAGAEVVLSAKAPHVAPDIDWARADLEAAEPTEHLLTLATCSYYRNPDDERTLAYAVGHPADNLLEGASHGRA